MAYKSVMAAAPYASMPDVRTVKLEMPDGSVTPVQGVPEGVSDEDVAKKYGGRVMSTAEDVVRSAASAVPWAISETATAIPKAILGGRRVLGMYQPEEWKQKAGQVQGIERFIKENTGSDYAPRTKAGEYAKSITAGAIPLPFVGSYATQAALGGLSGFLAQGAADAGTGQAGSVIAAMAPFAVAGGANMLRSRHPVTQTKNALEAITPEQKATMDHNIRAAKEEGLPMMAWQAAPEGSEIRNLGQAVASAPQSYDIRKIMAGQRKDITGDRSLVPPTRSVSSRVAGKMYDDIRDVSVDPSVVEAAKNKVLDVIREKRFAIDGPQADTVRSVASQFGDMVDVPVGDTIARLQKEMKSLPQGDKSRIAINREIVGRLSGSIPPEQVFSPKVSTIGEISNIKQNPKFPQNLKSVDVDTMTKTAVRAAIDDVIESVNKEFQAANQKWRKLKQIERNVEKTSALERPSQLSTASGAKTEVLPELLYAGATTPMWASVPLIRELAQKAMMNKYGKAFSSSDPTGLYKLASERPIMDTSRLLGLGLLSPFKQGEFQLYPEE